jgi:hypothetical protein
MKTFSLRSIYRVNRKPGYVEAVLAAATLVDGKLSLEDNEYRRIAREYAIQSGGPGTELKALLKTIGITAKPNCSCNKRAKVMDEKGCDWCEENIDEIDGWLAEESKKRKLPYLSLAGKTLIRMAIRRARKKGNGK